MKTSVRLNLEDCSDALEDILKKLPKLTMIEKVDICARLRGVAKNCEAIDKSVKEDITKQLKEKDGVVMGDVFKAVRKTGPVSRLDQKALKEDHPDIVEEYTRDTPQARITFESR